ncbi:DUF3693 domain-containing protein [Xylella fastidiosa]|nr:DUF3693 domain-containing protein [Xylella fastidiosa]
MQCPSNTNKKRSILKQIANATATLLIGAGITCPNPSQAQSISESSVMKFHIMPIMSIRWTLIKRDV